MTPKSRSAPDPIARTNPARAVVTLDELLRLKQKARGFSFLPRQPVHSVLTGRHASRLRGRGLNFEELRHYFEGDDTRTIDWLATARLGAPHVRIYTEERDRNVLLIVDQRLSMFFGSWNATKSVVAAETAAISAWRVTSLGDRVGAIVFSDTDVVEIRPEARDHAVTRILGAVAEKNQALPGTVSQSGNPAMFNQVLRRANGIVTHDWLVCLITDAAGADAETVEQVTRLGAHNDILTVFIFDPLEAELPEVGHAVICEGNRQIEVDTQEQTLRRRFAHDFSDRRARLAAFSRERSIPVIPISTDRDATEQVRQILGRRKAPSRRGSNTLLKETVR